MKTIPYKYVQGYIDDIGTGKIKACEEQRLLVTHIKKCFGQEDIYVDEELADQYFGLVKYFPYEQLFEWEYFLFTLWNCTFWCNSGMPRWPDVLCLIGRGAGKDGYIAFDSFAMISPYNEIRNYHVDICANNEEQAMTPLKDILDVMEDPVQRDKLKKHFYWTKEQATGIKSGSIVKGRTNSPKGKDGLRSGKVIFNEIHQYENYDNINVFTTGLGKKRHPRRGYFTTNGDVRDGPLDHLIERAERILHGEEPDNGLLPFVCKLNQKDDVHDPANWEMANPSLPYRPDLRAEIEKEYTDYRRDPARLPAFMTKRMNVPDGNPEIEVTPWENIEATKGDIPDMEGKRCTCGIDYMKVTDFASVNFHFRDGDRRYDINHSWLCLNSNDLARIRAPWREWAENGKLTLVDDVEISPDIITEYIAEHATKFHITKVALDNFRYALLAKSLKRLGFDAKEKKNVKLVRPSDIMAVVPVIDSCFANQYFNWGDNPPLRWATNNTKLIRSSRKEGSDTGNFYYGKIEAKSRKTDPFMALVASMTIEDELDGGTSEFNDLPVIT